MYKYLDLDTYKRKNHFLFFKDLAYPCVGVTVNVDITNLLKMIKSKKLPFFLSICYCISKAANRVTEFRQRIINNQIIEYDYCPTTHTVALTDDTFCFCKLYSDKPFEEYIPYAIDEQEKSKLKNTLYDEDTEEKRLAKIVISSIPWISFTSFICPSPIPADSQPKIELGKYFIQNDKVLLPLFVQCHHALVDGRQIAQFYEYLDEEMALITGKNNQDHLSDLK